MKAPDFWFREPGFFSLLLTPASLIWARGARFRQERGERFRPPVPVICVGNVVLGGQGKTPVALSLASLFPRAHFLSKGYGGSETGPLRVDPARHGASEVGDEPLLLANAAPVWIARDRKAGAEAAVRAGAEMLIMDDGFQDPSIEKTLSLLVTDGETGFGNRLCIPAGPLREPLEDALARADAVIAMGADLAGIEKQVGDKPFFRARLVPHPEAAGLAGRKVVAFAGIGRPAKFFSTLHALGARLEATYDFPDHHPYALSELGSMIDQAERLGATLVTTTKDHVRIPGHLREKIVALPVGVQWEDSERLARFLLEKLEQPR